MKWYLVVMISAGILILSWPPMPFAPLIFFSFVPLFVLQNRVRASIWLVAIFLTLFAWNTTTTYWIYNTRSAWALAVNVTNALIFTLPFLIYLLSKSSFGVAVASINFAISWLLLELLHLNWEFAYPFLNLGNALARYPEMFQWYEFTGSLGGSFWILCVNLLIAHSSGLKKRQPIYYYTLLPALAFLIPLAISVAMLSSFRNGSKSITVTAIQTAFDCHGDKYRMPAIDLVESYLEITKQSSANSNVIVWPETAITDAGMINEFSYNPIYTKIKLALSGKALKPAILSGAIVYRNWGRDAGWHHERTFHAATQSYLSTYNAAISINAYDNPEVIRVKSRLVPFEEAEPDFYALRFLRGRTGTLGGFTFSPNYASIGYLKVEGFRIVPLICYEILFGQDVGTLSQQGNMFVLMLNEGWYNSSIASKQFLYYTSLRAVETRRSIARSSNMGIAALIDETGIIREQSLNQFSAGAISAKMSASDVRTFYSEFGDDIILLVIVLLTLLSAIFMGISLSQKLWRARGGTINAA